MVGVSGQAWAANVVAADLECTNPTGCVQTYEISDGAVTEPKLAAGAVTNAKIAGPISTSKLEKPANVVIVAKSGGDFTTISAALAAINPTAENPYLIRVMPGTYVQSDTLIMKSYVHLAGSGKDTTTIVGNYYSSYVVILCSGVSHISISGFTITAPENQSRYFVGGINTAGSSFVTIENNHFKGGSLLPALSIGEATDNTIVRTNIFSEITGEAFNRAVIVGDGLPTVSNPNISDNLFQGNYIGLLIYSGSPTIAGNTFIGNGRAISQGQMSEGGSPIITNNIIRQNSCGIESLSGNPIIINNNITGNSPYSDIRTIGGTANISYNIFDTLSGWWGQPASYLGKYNLKSDGTDAPTTSQ